jgi:hypothetical protein
MTSTTPRIIVTALAVLAFAAPVAAAMPIDQHQGEHPSAESSPAQTQDLRNPDQQAPRPTGRVHSPGHPSQQPQSTKPVVITKTQPAPADDNGLSPFVYIVPSVVLIAMLAAGFGYARLSRRPASA